MKRKRVLLAAAVALLTMVGTAKAETILTDAQMDRVVAGSVLDLAWVIPAGDGQASYGTSAVSWGAMAGARTSFAWSVTGPATATLTQASVTPASSVAGNAASLSLAGPGMVSVTFTGVAFAQ